MEVGQKYYIIAHAYWHFVGEVAEVIGPKTVKLKNVCQVHLCGRNWSAFFASGFGNDTKFDSWPDGTTISAIFFAPWEHQIPSRKSK